MKISIENSNPIKPPACNLPGNTIVKFNKNSAYFVIPASKYNPGFWLTDNNDHHGASEVWNESKYYLNTDYTVIGTLKVEI